MSAHEVNDPGVSGKLTPVITEDGKRIYIREGMDVREALKLGQAALDAHDKRIMTTTIGGKRFPTYESSPVIAREAARTFAAIGAEVELALKGKKPDVVIAPASGSPVSGPGIPQGTVVVKVTKPIREKYPIQFNIRLLWIRLRNVLLNTLERLRKFLRRI